MVASRRHIREWYCRISETGIAVFVILAASFRRITLRRILQYFRFVIITIISYAVSFSSQNCDGALRLRTCVDKTNYFVGTENTSVCERY